MTWGFFGKIPGHGDFIDRGLPAAFKTGFDEWLQNGLAASKAALGSDWLNVYLTSPVWRFVLTTDVCGSQCWAGVVVPSVDRVGRYFPLTIAAAIPQDVIPLQVVTAATAWFEGAEAAAFAALEHDQTDAEALMGAVDALGEIPLGAAPLLAEPGSGAHTSATAFALPLAYGTSPGQGLLALSHRLLEARLGAAYSLWWTIGSDLVHPGLVVCTALPAPGSYAAMLSDQCAAPDWLRLPGYALRNEAALAGPAPPPADDILAELSRGASQEQAP